MLRRALAVVMVVLGGVALALLAASALLDHEALDRGALSRLPACSARAAGGSCALCGMSHSLVAMSRGDWGAAARWNAGGPWLWAALLLQVVIGAAAVRAGLAGPLAAARGAALPTRR